MLRRYPVPLSVERVGEIWPALVRDPRVACADAWSTACAAWWDSPHDDRLRRRVTESLYLTEVELDSMHARRPDETGLRALHAHVLAMRVAAEGGRTKRAAVANALRTAPVVAHERGGGLSTFPEAHELPARVATLARDLEALPAHPFVRAAWLTQAIGSTHPFFDANGGTGRLASSLELTRARLPPFVLSNAQRNGVYIDALVHSDDVGVAPLVELVYDVIQNQLALALMSPGGEVAAWDKALTARALRWEEAARERWKSALGNLGPIAEMPNARLAFATLARHGHPLPRNPTPRVMRWTTTTPLPVHVDLAVAPVKGGPVRWLYATLCASVGTDGELRGVVPREPISVALIAPDNEDGSAIDARFEHWLDHRIEQAVRGVAAWM